MWKERLKNSSYTLVDAMDLVGDDGDDLLVVSAKLAFRFDADGKLRLAARPLRRFDIGFETGGLRYPCDFGLPFRGTDCIVLGTAHPGLVPVESRVVSMRVGTVKKAIRVHGPRVYMAGPRGVRPGPSGNVVTTPITFDHAYGGFEPHSIEREHANPIGRGFAVDPSRLVGTEAHRLEPAEPIGLPASAGCFAAIDTDWQPRAGYVGTYDEKWRRTRAPIAPADRDARCHSVVRPEQRSSSPLKLPFSIELCGFRGDDETTIELPLYDVRVSSELARGSGDVHETTLSRVLVDVDERVIELLFTAHVPLPTKWEKLKFAHVLAVGSLPDDVKRYQARA
jgi:hypothetical protein